MVEIKDKWGRVISKESLSVAKTVEQVVSDIHETHSVEPYDRLKGEGFWRILLYRESKATKEALISLIVSKDTVSEEVMADVKKKLLEKF